MKVSVENRHGINGINIAGQYYSPLAFKSFRPNETNIREFYTAGVRLFNVLSSGVISALGVPYSLYGESWIGENTYDFTAIDRQMELFIRNAPDAYFAPMLDLNTRPWYLEKHPEQPNSFLYLSQIAADEGYRKAAADYLKAAIAHCEEKYGERIYGYFLLGGMTTEWFSGQDQEAPHPIKNCAYRRRYGEDLPTTAQLTAPGGVFLSAQEHNVYQARRFHGELVTDTVLHFAQQAQAVLHHNKLVGVYYGYLLELGGTRLFESGHLGYERLFLSPDIDMISSPSAYGYRRLTDPSALMVTQKTLQEHNKVYFLEFDHITHVAPRAVPLDPAHPDDGNGCMVEIPGADAKCRDETEALNLLYRDFLLCQSSGTALWWFDMFDGWFRSPGMLRAIRQMVDLDAMLSRLDRRSAAEVAVIVSGEAMYRVRKTAGLASSCLSHIRRTLAEAGAPYDLYSAADITLPQMERYRFLLFVDAYDIPLPQRLAIERLQRAGKTMLWLYAPDYATGGRLEPDAIGALTGIAVRQQDTSHGGLVWQGTVLPEPKPAGPYFCAVGGEVIARFEDGTTAVARRGSSLYAATVQLPAGLLRQLYREAGVRLYSETDQVYTYVNHAIIGVYNATEEAAELPVSAEGEWPDLLTGERFTAENGRLRLPPRPLRAYLFLRRDPAAV